MLQALRDSTNSDYGSTASVSTNATSDGYSSTEFIRIIDYIAYNIKTTKSCSKQFKKQLALIGRSEDLTKLREQLHINSMKIRIVAEATIHDLNRLTGMMEHGDFQRINQVNMLRHKFRTEVEKLVALQKKILKVLRQQCEEAPFKEHVLFLEHKRQVLAIEKDVFDMNLVMATLKHEQDEQLDTCSSKEGHGKIEEICTAIPNIERRRQRRRIILKILVFALIITLILTGIIMVCHKKI